MVDLGRGPGRYGGLQAGGRDFKLPLLGLDEEVLEMAQEWWLVRPVTPVLRGLAGKCRPG